MAGLVLFLAIESRCKSTYIQQAAILQANQPALARKLFMFPTTQRPAPSEGRERKRERIGTVHTGGPPLRQPLLQAKHGTTHRTEGDEGGPSDAVVIRSAVKSAAHRQKQREFFGKWWVIAKVTSTCFTMGNSAEIQILNI